MSKYEKLRERMARWKEQGQEQLGHVLQTAEVGAVAFGFGFMRGKMGDENGNLDVAGIPASLGSAVVLHGLGFMGVFGKHGEHAHNLGDGALAEYAVVHGMRMGAARSDFAGSRRIAGRPRVAGSLGNNPFAGRNPFGFTCATAANPFVRTAA
jgi:hypothetical protein